MIEQYDEIIEMELEAEAKAFPIHRFCSINGTLNIRKIRQLHPDFQQEALNLFFIRRAYKVHGTRYGYANVEYKSLNQYVYIICKEHGVFKQTARVHLAGSGCQKCGMESRLRIMRGEEIDE